MTVFELLVKYENLMNRLMVACAFMTVILILDVLAIYKRGDRTKRSLIMLVIAITLMLVSLTASLWGLSKEFKDIKTSVESKSITRSEEETRTKLEQRSLNP